MTARRGREAKGGVFPDVRDSNNTERMTWRWGNNTATSVFFRQLVNAVSTHSPYVWGEVGATAAREGGDRTQAMPLSERTRLQRES